MGNDSLFEVPQFITHYHLADKPPFLNLCDLSETDLAEVLADLTRRRESAGLKRVFGPRYMRLRRLTEEKMYRLFVEVGGQPKRLSPHYFVLGSSKWYEGLSPDMRQVVLPLAGLPTEVASFTFPDSFTAMGLVKDFGLAYEPRPYHERVYRMEELKQVVAEFGQPADDEDEYTGYERRPFEKYIEVQIWADEPVRLGHQAL
jgi:hypothetical protein